MKEKITETISIWWRNANPWSRAAGLWVVASISALLLFLIVSGGIWVAFFVILVTGVPTATVISVIYITQELTKANRQRARAERIRAAYTYKGPEFRSSQDFDN